MARNKQKDPEEYGKRDKEHRVVLGVLCGIFLVYTATLLFPFLWMAFNSLKTKVDFVFRQWELPTKVMWENYSRIFTEYNLPEMFTNSLILCVAIPTLSSFATCSAAHALANFQFKLNKFLYYLAISVMFIPVAGSLATTYKLMYDTYLINTHIGVTLLSSSGFGFNFLLMYSVYKNISPTYAEAAELDGAGYWRTFLTIVTPQAGAMVLAVWILCFIGVWNNYETVYLFLSGYPTLSVGVYEIRNKVTKTGDYPSMFAVILVTSAPMVVLFLVFQKKIMQVSLGGGIKE